MGASRCPPVVRQRQNPWNAFMKLKAFIQSAENHPTTLAELRRAHEWAETEQFLGLYAYATQSGAIAFDLAFGSDFWDQVPSQWLFGIDYGRTQPQALRFLIERSNVEVRIHDGAWVVERNGFLPRRDFHMKAGFLTNSTKSRFGMVVGSGNFSSNGLRQAAECGASLHAATTMEFKKTFRSAFRAAKDLWEAATPVEDILDSYEERWAASAALEAPEPEAPAPNYDELEVFWIEAGYVTRNRGPDKPGNQIDMPRGMNRYFGFNAPDNLAVNSVIGEVTFEPPAGGPVTNNLRLGNNMMEKISLPIPETHGFDMYDGKVLVFSPQGGHYRMWALEAEDFESAFGHRLASVRVTKSGRRYGHIE
ncbi:hypothetical protein ACVIHD_006155 [Bradyrhizobium embrapense]